MQAFMQSLQMRCPVAAQRGLSTATIASAPMLFPRAATMFISEIFSSSGQPARVTPKTVFLKPPSFSCMPLRQLVCGLVVEPAADRLGIAQFPGERALTRVERRRRAADQCLQLLRQLMAVELERVGFLDLLDRAALHEQPLHRIKRRQLIVP